MVELTVQRTSGCLACVSHSQFHFAVPLSPARAMLVPARNSAIIACLW
jgi:hypothetical protein